MNNVRTMLAFGVTDGREGEPMMESGQHSMPYRIGRTLGRILGSPESPECEACGRSDVVTPRGDAPRCSRHVEVTA